MADVDKEILSDFSLNLGLRVRVRKLSRVMKENEAVIVQLHHDVKDLEVSKPGRRVQGEASSVDEIIVGLPILVDQR